MFESVVGKVRLGTPLILASGRITETPDFFLASRALGCSGIVTRSLRVEVPPERAQVPAPRYHFIDQSTMLNCEWSNEYHWSNWLNGWIQLVKKSDGVAIISLSGRDTQSCIQLIDAFDRVGVDSYEINVSCSHSGAIHGNLNVDVEWLAKLMKAIRPVTDTPIWIKLSYSHLLLSMAKEAENLGADAVVCTNTIGPGLVLDTETGQPVLGIKGGAGGMSGHAIFPIALRCVYELANTLNIPIVGVGGIYTADDAIQMLMAGASALQLYTAPSVFGPSVFGEIMQGLEKFLRTHQQFQSISDLIGYSQKWHDRDHCFEAPSPKWLMERCTGCGHCLTACHFGAIQSVNEGIIVDHQKCVGCTACISLCPTGSLVR